jgi:hypothetical protein
MKKAEKAKVKESRKTNRGSRAGSLGGVVRVADVNPRRNLSDEVLRLQVNHCQTLDALTAETSVNTAW